MNDFHDPELCLRVAMKVMGMSRLDCIYFDKYRMDGAIRGFDPCCNPAHSWMVDQKMIIEHGWEKRFTWYPPNEFRPIGSGVVGFVKYRPREERDRIEKLPWHERMKFSGPEFSHHMEFPLYGYTADVSAVDPLHATALAADVAFPEKELDVIP